MDKVYNCFQHYDIDSISQEMNDNDFKVRPVYANVEGYEFKYTDVFSFT
jgi:hypothetical protein